MYTVHCRVYLDNKCGFWLLTLLRLRRLHPLMRDSRAKLRKDPQKSKNSSIMLTDSCLNNSMYKHNLVLKTNVCSLSSCHHRALVGSYKFSPSLAVSQCSQDFALHLAIALHLARALLCKCCHDPCIVKSAQTRPSITGFTQLAHPFRCSRSTLTTVCFCASVSGSAAPSPDPQSARHRHLVVECGIHGQ